mmetsp:Transcript_36129/g.78897  ORF Transcript_36129/g.78897 Transcript_36129/m.78897 type:complete len:244 (-) Transcript_36129:886-1617(-)
MHCRLPLLQGKRGKGWHSVLLDDTSPRFSPDCSEAILHRRHGSCRALCGARPRCPRRRCWGCGSRASLGATCLQRLPQFCLSSAELQTLALPLSSSSFSLPQFALGFSMPALHFIVASPLLGQFGLGNVQGVVGAVQLNGDFFKLALPDIKFIPPDAVVRPKLVRGFPCHVLWSCRVRCLVALFPAPRCQQLELSQKPGIFRLKLPQRQERPALVAPCLFGRSFQCSNLFLGLCNQLVQTFPS